MVWIDYLIMGLFALVMIGIAIYTRSRSKSVNDFLLAGKKGLNGWMTAFAYGTTYFSAVIFVGYAGKYGSAFGVSSVLIGVGNAIIGTLIAWLVLAKRTKNMTQRLSAKTMPEFFEKRYGSRALKLVTAVIIFIFLIPYSASVYSGISSLFETVYGIPGWIVMIILALITAVYLFFGGYFATALSDFIQGIIMIVGVIIMVVLLMSHKETVNWNICELFANGPNPFSPSSNESFIFGDAVSLLSLIGLTSFGVWALPQTIHKYYAIRDKKAILQGIIVSTSFALLIGAIAYFSGALSYFFPESIIGTNPDRYVPLMLKTVIPVGVMGIITVLVLSASMSTLSSVSLAGASVMAVDLYKGAVNKKASDKHVNWVMRGLCLAFVVISVVLAILNEESGFSAIAYLMGISWGTLAGCFMGPYVLGVIWKRVTVPAVWASVISSLTLTASLIVLLGYGKGGFACTFGEALKNGISCSPLIGVICMAFSVIITVIVSLCTKKPSDEILYNAFDKSFEGEIK